MTKEAMMEFFQDERKVNIIDLAEDAVVPPTKLERLIGWMFSLLLAASFLFVLIYS